MNHYDVIVIGGGASGMVAAIEAAKRGLKVAILEHKDRLGKKILATGNGKCNYTNRYQTIECYRGNDPSFAFDLVKRFDEAKTIKYFQELGIYPKERNGYVYPNSEQAASVADVLAMECAHQKVSICLNTHVLSVHQEKNQFMIQCEAQQYTSKAVILAAGGCAAPKQGSEGSGFRIAKNFGHTIAKPFPALVQLKASENYGKPISGVRLEAKGTLTSKGNVIASEQGEFLLTDYGVSGIPILQMSRYAVQLVEAKQSPVIHLDFFPTMKSSELETMLSTRFMKSSYKSVEEAMVGLLNNKLNFLLLKLANIKPTASAKMIKEKEVKVLAGFMKDFKYTIIGSNGFDQAQVSAGGVLTKEINPTTLESTLIKNLYFAGEVIDVDGTCGGYNLQWAWSSGFISGNHVLANK